MTISPFAAREGTSAPQWPNVKKCCRHLVPSSDFFVQSYAVPIRKKGGGERGENPWWAQGDSGKKKAHDQGT